jgi:hypothetical protein
LATATFTISDGEAAATATFTKLDFSRVLVDRGADFAIFKGQQTGTLVDASVDDNQLT